MKYPRKHLGQHFLRDKTIIKNIVRAISPAPQDHLVEIGPGLGALTMDLLPLVASMDVIELDRDLISTLVANCQHLGALKIHVGDALSFDFRQIAVERGLLRIVGNLPYQISTPLIFYLIDQITVIRDMHFMLQKEVVDRLAAKIGTKAYGRLSVMVQYHCAVESLFTVHREAFYPVPKVTSAVVRLVPKTPEIVAQDYSLFARIVKQAFNYRRKTLHNSLNGLVTCEQLDILAIDPKTRAEQITVENFVRMSNLCCNRKN